MICQKTYVARVRQGGDIVSCTEPVQTRSIRMHGICAEFWLVLFDFLICKERKREEMSTNVCRTFFERESLIKLKHAKSGRSLA